MSVGLKSSISWPKMPEDPVEQRGGGLRSSGNAALRALYVAVGSQPHRNKAGEVVTPWVERAGPLRALKLQKKMLWGTK